jgi:hypothetical protein
MDLLIEDGQEHTVHALLELVAKLDDMVLSGRNRQDFSPHPEKLVCEFQTAAIVIPNITPLIDTLAN